MPNMISALAIDDSRRYLKAPSLATLAPAPCTMSANAGRESISMPSTSGMNPALSIMTQAPSRQEHSSIPDLYVACAGEDESPCKAAADNHELRQQRKTVDADFFG